MEIIYDKKELVTLCKDLLYQANELRQYVDVAVDSNCINTDSQLQAVNYAIINNNEIDRLLYLIQVMLEHRKEENANRFEDSTNTDSTSDISRDNN